MDHTFHYFQFLFAYPTLTFVVVQLLSSVHLFAIPWTVACQASLSSTVSQSLLRFMSIELVMLSNHLILCCPFLLLPLVFCSIRVFSNEAALPIRWPKYWSFSFSTSTFNEYSRLISFRMDWFDLLDVQFMWKDFNKAPSIVLGILASVFSQYLSYRLGVESLFSAYHKASFTLCPFCL